MQALFEQRTWRIVGGVSILIAAAMAWYGSEHMVRGVAVWQLAVYWLVFLLLFLLAMYMVLLDLRYIRMQHAIDQRDLYLKTLADETVREALRKAMEQGTADSKK